MAGFQPLMMDPESKRQRTDPYGTDVPAPNDGLSMPMPGPGVGQEQAMVHYAPAPIIMAEAVVVSGEVVHSQTTRSGSPDSFIDDGESSDDSSDDEASFNSDDSGYASVGEICCPNYTMCGEVGEPGDFDKYDGRCRDCNRKIGMDLDILDVDAEAETCTLCKKESARVKYPNCPHRICGTCAGDVIKKERQKRCSKCGGAKR